MDAATAKARLEMMTAAATEPTLSDDNLYALLDMARAADSAGRAPSDADWEPTYDLNRAAAEGWRWKAAQVSADFGFQADGAIFQRQQVLDHCLQMAQQYGRKVVGSAAVASALALANPADDDDD